MPAVLDSVEKHVVDIVAEGDKVFILVGVALLSGAFHFLSPVDVLVVRDGLGTLGGAAAAFLEFAIVGAVDDFLERANALIGGRNAELLVELEGALQAGVVGLSSE